MVEKYNFAKKVSKIDINNLKNNLNKYVTQADFEKVTKEKINNYESNIVSFFDNSQNIFEIRQANIIVVEHWVNQKLKKKLTSIKQKELTILADDLFDKSKDAIQKKLNNFNFEFLTLINQMSSFVDKKLSCKDVKCFIPFFNKAIFNFADTKFIERELLGLIDYVLKEHKFINDDDLTNLFINIDEVVSANYTQQTLKLLERKGG